MIAEEQGIQDHQNDDTGHYSNNAIISMQASASTSIQLVTPLQKGGLYHQQQHLPQAHQPVVVNHPQAMFQGAKITEIENEAVEVHEDAADVIDVIDVASANTDAVIQHHPQAVHASPVLVLHDEQHRHKMRQKALVDSVESKV